MNKLRLADVPCFRTYQELAGVSLAARGCECGLHVVGVATLWWLAAARTAADDVGDASDLDLCLGVFGCEREAKLKSGRVVTWRYLAHCKRRNRVSLS